MANKKKSAEKQARRAVVNRERNRTRRAALRTAVKKVRAAVAAGDGETAAAQLPRAMTLVDAAAGKKVLHRNAAARTKSRLAKAIAKLG